MPGAHRLRGEGFSQRQTSTFAGVAFWLLADGPNFTHGGESLSSEVAALKDERDVIRTRVSDMLRQLDTLSL